MKFNFTIRHCYPLAAAGAARVAGGRLKSALAIAAGAAILAAWPAAAQSLQTLPVYRVTQTGATAGQANILAQQLNIPPNQIVLSNGWLSFTDPTNYLAVPVSPITDPAIISNLMAVTRNPYGAIPLAVQGLNFNIFSNQPYFGTNAAVAVFSNALTAAYLVPESLYNGFIYGIPAPSFTIFDYWLNLPAAQIQGNKILETKVDYLMYDTNGYPFIGPGMQVQASFDGNGHVTRLLYAARQLEYGASVTAVPLDVASNRAAALFPPGTQLSLQTVYWCPPFQPVANTSSGWYPTNIIPWYLCHGSLNVTNPQTGLVSSSNLRARLIPATDDSAYVPSVSFSASAPNLTEVFASANVTGGTRPYTYNWAGSFSTVGQGSNTPALSYTPVTRFPPPSLQVLHPSPGVLTVYWQFHPLPGPGPDPGPDAWQLEFTTDLNLGPNGWTPVTNPVQSNDGVYSVDLATGNSPGFYRLRMVDSTLNTTENVSLTVTDANGISVNTNVTLNVIAQIVPAAKNAGVISYGTESPREPDFAVDRIGWQEGMGTSGGGGGSQSFCWMGDLAWPGDFIEPTPPGALMPTPWVNGDADYSNWGVNAASIVLNNTDGAPDYFASSEPGATIAEYATAELYHPGYPGGTVVINLDDWLDTATTHYYNINYDGSWGPIPPEDNLCWLLMDCCDVLDQNSSDGTAVERWSPAFGGLHILTGWNSEELLGDGSFEKNFAQDMLGIYGPAQTVLQAWFNAAHAAGASHGTPAAMGAFGPAYTSDYNDYYWGKGPVNATIPPWLVTGWWYIQDTLPASPPH